MSRSLSSRVRAILLSLAWLGFACRLVVPAGYMPASPEEGGFIKLCPAGPAGALFSAVPREHAAHDHPAQSAGDPATHDHGGDHDYDTDYCPAGAFYSSAAAVATFGIPALTAASTGRPDPDPVPAASRRPGSHQPRAPPVQPA